MQRFRLFLVTALLEIVIGLLLLFLPSIPISLLIGSDSSTPESEFVGRIAGAALLALGAASWLARSDGRSPASRGLVVGVLIYDGTVAALLAYAGFALGLEGDLLWLAAVLHAVLAGWCVVALIGRE